MCFVASKIRHHIPQFAFRDVVCYKIMKQLGPTTFESPFYRAIWEQGKLQHACEYIHDGCGSLTQGSRKPIKRLLFEKSISLRFHEIEKGLHGWLDEHQARHWFSRELSDNRWQNPYCLVTCVIPRGSWYFKNDHEVVALRMKIL